MIPLRVLGDRVLVALEPKQTHIEASTGMNYHEEQRTESGLILVRPTDQIDLEVQTRGIVVAVGEKSDSVSREAVREAVRSAQGYVTDSIYPNGPRIDREDLLQAIKEMTPEPFDVQLGDCVIFPASAGQAIPHDGVDYVLLRESELLAVLEPVTEAEVV